MDEGLTLEKLKVSERLVSVENCVKHLVELHERDTAHVQVLLAKHNETLYGNGKEGITTRLKSLEDSAESRRFHIRMLWTATAGVAMKALWDLVRRG